MDAALSASPPTPHAVVVSWSAPERDGSAPIIAYSMFRTNGVDAKETLVAQVPADAYAYADDACPTVVLCEYRVSAVNVAGESERGGPARALDALLALPEAA